MKLKNLILFLKTKAGGLFKNKKAVFVLLIVILVFIVLVMPSGKSKTNLNKNESVNLSKESSFNYELELEEKIRKMLLAIAEVKNASVMVVCDETEKVEYLKNTSETISGSGESSSQTKTEEVVYEKNGSNNTPIIITTYKPKVVGVWIIVTEISPSTKLAIIKSIASVLNINESCISILQEWQYESFVF